MRFLSVVLSVVFSSFCFSSLTYAAAGDALFGDGKPEIYNPAKEVTSLASKGKTKEALELADEELEKNPKNLNLRFQKGVIYTQTGKIKEAKEVFEQLIREYPEVAEPYNNLAVIYASEGNKGRAKELLEQAVMNNSRSLTSYTNLADVYLAFAADMYKEAEKLAPNNKAIKEKITAIDALIK